MCTKHLNWLPTTAAFWNAALNCHSDRHFDHEESMKATGLKRSYCSHCCNRHNCENPRNDACTPDNWQPQLQTCDLLLVLYI